MYCRVGDELRFSPGFFTDLWHWLCSDISVPWLVVVYFVFEVLYVLFFGLVLWLCRGVEPTSWYRCLLASARSVTVLANRKRGILLGGGGGRACTMVGRVPDHARGNLTLPIRLRDELTHYSEGDDDRFSRSRLAIIAASLTTNYRARAHPSTRPRIARPSRGPSRRLLNERHIR